MKYRVEFKKLFCCAIGLLGSYLAHGADFLQTKHGVLSIAGDFQQNKLVLNGKTLSLPGGDALSLEQNRKTHRYERTYRFK